MKEIELLERIVNNEINYLKSCERSRKRYKKILDRAVTVDLSDYINLSYIKIIDWLRANVRNINYAKTRRNGTAWWPIKNSQNRIIGFGFKNPEHALMFKMVVATLVRTDD